MSASAHFVFLVRNHSTADHTPPLAYALRKAGAKVTIYLDDPLHNHYADYRFQFLRQALGAATPELRGGQLFGELQSFLLKTGRLAYWRLVALTGRGPRWSRRLSFRLACRIKNRVDAVAEVRRDKAAQRGFSDKYLGRSAPLVVVLDHNVSSFAKTVVTRMRERGVPVISVPHSIPHIIGHGDGFSGFGFFDTLVMPNEAVARRCRQDGLPEGRVVVLGAPRFSSEWMATLRRILPPVRLPVPPSGQRKVLLLGSWGPEVDQDAMRRTVAELMGHSAVFLGVQAHTGTSLVGIQPLSGLEQDGGYWIAPPEVPTPALLDWAEIVLFTETSVIYDALIMGKQILFMRHVSRLSMDFEQVISGWATADHQHFMALLNRCIDEPGYRPYSAAERERCVAEMVTGGQSDILLAYTRFLLRVAAPTSALREDLAVGSTEPGAFAKAPGSGSV